jgi:hypothetical protein
MPQRTQRAQRKAKEFIVVVGRVSDSVTRHDVKPKNAFFALFASFAAKCF